jgi:hypothetical protein
MSTDFNPFSHLNKGKLEEGHPAGRILNGIPDPLSVENLTLFFKDAFSPNTDEFIPYSSFKEFIHIDKNKIGYLNTIENMMDNRSHKENYNILDLASGDILFLKKLLHQHGQGECSEGKCSNFSKDVAKKVKYVAVDKGFSSKFLDPVLTLLSKYKNCFELICHSLDIGRTQDLDYLKYIYKETPFDLIILSNTLHEISPAAWPDILSTIPELLNDDGHFVFLDLTNPMALEEIDDSFKKFISGQSFWEADAIYCYRSDVQELIDKIGFDGTLKLGHDHDIPYWYVKAKNKGDLLPYAQRKEAAFSFLSTFVEKHLNEWKEISRTEREKVRGNLVLEFNPYLFIFSAIRYLCLCASDTRTRECLESLNLKETIASLK